MVDELFDRDYRASRGVLNATIAQTLRRLARAISSASQATHRIQFSAPWTAAPRGVRPR